MTDTTLIKASKLSRVDILGFRGIPNVLSIDFYEERTSPMSVVLTGDNGSGKSSIVDAIEFGLQGHFAQSKHVASTRLPSIISYATTSTPTVRITLADGTTIERQVLEDEEGLLTNNARPHPAFDISPFVLRRADILRFLDAPDAERTLVFWNYLRSPGTADWTPPRAEELANLRDQRLTAKVERDRVGAELAKMLNLSVRDIPVGPKDFQSFISQHLFGGLTKEDFEKRGLRVKVDKRVEDVAERFQRAANRHVGLKARIKRFAVEPQQSGFPKHLIPAMNDFLGAVALRLTTAFKSVSPVSFVDRFRLEFGTIGDLALRISIDLVNGRTSTPRQILSEANQDLLALLFFVGLVQESASRGQARLLILDDVLQSVDATIRVAFVNYLVREFNDWQLVFTVHDRLWKSQLCQILRRNSHPFRELDIAGWSFDSGPIILESRSAPSSALKEAMKSGRPSLICSEAGLLLERLSNDLSVSMGTSITRRADDRYTLGDLWPGVCKVLRRTQFAGEADSVDQWIHLRNLLGAHYNDWAQGVSLTEAQHLGEATLALLDAVYCDACGRVVAASAVAHNTWSCRCGNRALTRA